MGPNLAIYVLVAVALVGVVVLFVLNTNVLAKVQNLVTWLFKKIGGRAYEVERQFVRHKNLKQRGLLAKYYRWAHGVLVNQGLLIRGITVTGFTFYSVFWAIVITSAVSVLYKLNMGLTIFSLILVLGVLFIMNTLRAAGHLERREALIMDTLDMIVPMLSRGVKNAITLLLPAINPIIRGEFETFLNNLKNKVPFEDAMQLLQSSLGNSFESFAQKAIIFEHDEEEGMIEIFSDIVEDNQNKRILRRENNEIFTELRIQLVVSLLIIGVFSAIFASMDNFMFDFFLYSSIGKFTVLTDAMLILIAFGYITLVKSKEFE